MKNKMPPPGEYNVVMDRKRKIRGKELDRFHMTIVDGEYKGLKITVTSERMGKKP